MQKDLTFFSFGSVFLSEFMYMFPSVPACIAACLTAITPCKRTQDGEECSELSIAYSPAKGTMCCSQVHGLPEQHRCGTEVYSPHTEICCEGHR